MNGEASNDPFAKKKRIYEKSGYLITRELAKKEDWNSAEIKKRSSEMAKEALELRRIVPKGTNLDILTPRDIVEIANNVNSYTRPSLGNMVPMELARQRLPEELFDAFGYELIDADVIIMKPELIPAIAAEVRARKRKR